MHVIKVKLPVKNLIGIKVDGANVMIRKNNPLRPMTKENFVTRFI